MRPPERLGSPTFGCALSGSPFAAALISPRAASAAWGPSPQLAPAAATPSSWSRATASRACTPASVCPSSSNVSWATIGSDETSCTARIAVSSSSRS